MFPKHTITSLAWEPHESHVLLAFALFVLCVWPPLLFRQIPADLAWVGPNITVILLWGRLDTMTVWRSLYGSP